MSENVTAAWHSPEERPREDSYCVVAYEDVFGMCYAVACMSNGVWFSTDDNWPRRKRLAAWMPIPGIDNIDKPITGKHEKEVD